MPASVTVQPTGPVSGSIRPPGSKSLTNRALLCAALADGESTLTGALQSEDTEVMIAGLQKIGVDVEVRDGGRTIVVGGQAKRTNQAEHVDADSNDFAELFIANSGTTIRFLAAGLSAVGGKYRLVGVPRMHERPIGDLVDAISGVIDGTIVAESEGGCPPVQIESAGWKPGSLQVGGGVSSQYLSGLMMAAPASGMERNIDVVGELVSKPYVEMTASVIRDFGGEVETGLSSTTAGCTESLRVGSTKYRGVKYAIEPDASAASYFWATAAITGGTITVEGLSRNALQGDVGFCDVLEMMGCEVQHGTNSITVTGRSLRGVDVDMNAISDTVQTLSVVALFADGPTRVRGVAHNRFKETDRIGDLARELRKLGAEVTEHEDGLTITPPATVGSDSSSLSGLTDQSGQSSAANCGTPSGLNGAQLSTYHDHRMAMSLSLAGLRIKGVEILDPSCTVKTYPEFFADLESLTGTSHHWRSADQHA